MSLYRCDKCGEMFGPSNLPCPTCGGAGGRVEVRAVNAVINPTFGSEP